MSFDLFWTLLIFTIVMTVTPGPNNMMLLASGVNFGYRATLPHMAGIAIGFAFMVIVVGLGLGEVFKAYPVVFIALSYAGAAYMLYLAWKIATAGPVNESRRASRPMTFLQAAGFQWVNPKAWMMALYAIATYSVPGAYWFSLALIAATFAGVNFPSCSTWVLFGSGLRRWLNQPKLLRIFNVTMALLLVLSLLPVLFHP